MLTLRKINEAIRAAGIDAEVCRGVDYQYFMGNDCEWASDRMVMVYRINDLSLDQWVAEARAVAADSARRSPYEGG